MQIHDQNEIIIWLFDAQTSLAKNSRVVDVEKPVEAHIDTLGNVDHGRVIHGQRLVNGGKAVDHLWDIHCATVL